MISLLLKITPKKLRKDLALRILSTSPHYFIYQGSTRYKGLSNNEVLIREHQRNLTSRKEIFEKILRDHLKPHMMVLDFGCGPGNLAIHISNNVRRVLALDISRGVIACAKELNNSPNICYVAGDRRFLRRIADSSLDLIYSFAVVQHLRDDLLLECLDGFYRILKSGGKVICHFAIGEKRIDPEGFLGRNASLRYRERSEPCMRKMVHGAGFQGIDLFPVRKIGHIEDDIGRQHLFICTKPEQRSDVIPV